MGRENLTHILAHHEFCITDNQCQIRKAKTGVIWSNGRQDLLPWALVTSQCTITVVTRVQRILLVEELFVDKI